MTKTDATEPSKYLAAASRMRDALTRAEEQSGGKVKYGDLKRTMSPIRTRPDRQFR